MTQNPPLVSAIVLNWNGKRIIESCLDSLLRQSHVPLEVIVVDNGSTDGSLALLKDKYASRVRIFENPRNLGFAGGCNVGIRAARGEYIALLNSDATAEQRWVEELLKAMQRSPNIGMCCGKTYFAHREGILENTGHIVFRDGLGRGRGRLEKDEGQYDKQDSVLCPTGCAAFYRKDMMEAAGLFDEKFFAYADDIDVGFRGRLLGYDCAYVPTAVAYHELSASFGMLSPLKAYLLERNRLWVLIKCFPLKHLAAAPFHTLARYVYIFYGILNRVGPVAKYVKKTSPLSLLMIFVKVYFSTLVNLPYLLAERHKVMKTRKATNEDFESWLDHFGVSARDVALNEVSY